MLKVNTKYVKSLFVQAAHNSTNREFTMNLDKIPSDKKSIQQYLNYCNSFFYQTT